MEFKVGDGISDIDIYRKLNTNPSPFHGFVKYENSSIISSSPERLVSIRGSHIQTRPIAGTRPRGVSGLMDIELTKELINQTKRKQNI